MGIQILITVFEAVALLLGIGILGLWIMSRRILPQKAMGILSVLALDISLPSLVFVNILENFKPAEFSDWWQLPLYWAGFTVFLGCLTAFFSLISGRNTRREFAASLFFQNALFFPLAILGEMFGVDSPYVVKLFFFVMFFPSLFFSTAHLFFKRSQKSFDWAKIINKVLLATIAATCLRLFGAEWVVPEFAVSALRLLGNMTLPLLFLILGGNMYIDFKAKGKIHPLEVGKFVLVKNFLFPIASLLLLVALRPPFPIALFVLLEASVPPLTAIPILTERAGGNREIVNQFMVASFAVSLVSIPLMMGLFSLYFPLPAP
ncbi:MAG: AEC family transporter [Desulfonatronovibrionaceae bacterium]